MDQVQRWISGSAAAGRGGIPFEDAVPFDAGFEERIDQPIGAVAEGNQR